MSHSLALRLTLWYGAIFSLSSLLAFALVYGLTTSIVLQQTDDDLEGDIEEFAALMQTGGLARVEAEIRSEAETEAADQVYFRLWDGRGQLLHSASLDQWPGLTVPWHVLQAPRDEMVMESLRLPGRDHLVRVVYGAISADLLLEIGESMEDNEELQHSILRGFIVALLVILPAGGAIGWFMAKRALSGVQRVTHTAARIASGALDQRVAVGRRGDEIDALAETFNGMLDRIQALVQGMREMTDNLAHDLRSPLGRIRASAEMLLANPDLRAEAEALAFETTEECDRLLEIINTTLDIAEAESGAARLNLTDVDLKELVVDAVELFQSIAESRRVSIDLELPEHCHILGDRQRLQRVVANLLDNALKYTSQGGAIVVKLADLGERVEILIKDSGIGMSPEETVRIFERFYRTDRSRSLPGNGLGLSLALAFVRAHSGEIKVHSSPATGSSFTVVLSRAN